MRVAALCLLLALPAGAQVPAASTCTARDPVTAEINAREGIRLAKAAQFGDAEALFKTAARLDECMSKYPWLLGRALERQEKLDEAEQAYQTVIQRFPTSIEFTKAQGALAKLRAARSQARAREKEALARERAAEAVARRKAEEDARRKAEQQARALAEARTTPDSSNQATGRTATSTPWSTLGWLSTGVGVLAVGAGVGFAIAALDADEKLDVAATRPDRARYDELVGDRDTYSTMSWAGYGVGAGLLVGGVAMILIGHDQSSQNVTPTVMTTGNGGTIGVVGHF